MAPGKGYVLMTDFTTHPDAFPCIGTIIQDPFRPMDKVLSVPEEDPLIIVHRQKHKQIRSSNLAAKGMAWAQFCQNIQAKVEGSRDQSTVSTYESQYLDTLYIKSLPSKQEVCDRSQEPEVSDAMGTRRLGGQPVFLITGLKVARAFKHTTHVSSEHQLEAAALAPITETAQAGVEIGVSKSRVFEEESQAAPGSKNDIVFAYRLHMIVHDSWLSRSKAAKVSLKAHEPDGAFSSTGPRADENPQPDIMPVDLDALSRIAGENEDQFHCSTATEETEHGAEEVFCVILDDSD